MSEAPSDFKSPIPESTTNPAIPGDFSATGLLGEFMKDFKHEESKEAPALSPDKPEADFSPAKEGLIKDVLGRVEAIVRKRLETPELKDARNPQELDALLTFLSADEQYEEATLVRDQLEKIQQVERMAEEKK